MTDWAAFAGFAGVVLAFLLLLAHASQSAIDVDGDSATDAGADPTSRIASRERALRDPAEAPGGDGTSDAETGRRPDPAGNAPSLSTATLLANVALSQGLFGVLLIGGALYAGVPAPALGVSPETTDAAAIAAGVGLGVALYAANRLGAAAGDRFGLTGSEALREALAPSSAAGWVALLGVVLPVIAGFEELLFRGALIGALSAGFGVSPWLLAVGSSVAFALGHGAQGRVGVAVTGVLGFVLAAAFVLTGSLLAVVVAHYLVNALEFVVHEGLN